MSIDNVHFRLSVAVFKTALKSLACLLQQQKGISPAFPGPRQTRWSHALVFQMEAERGHFCHMLTVQGPSWKTGWKDSKSQRSGMTGEQQGLLDVI